MAVFCCYCCCCFEQESEHTAIFSGLFRKRYRYVTAHIDCLVAIILVAVFAIATV